jgi:hypothetical protein
VLGGQYNTIHAIQLREDNLTDLDKESAKEKTRTKSDAAIELNAGPRPVMM